MLVANAIAPASAAGGYAAAVLADSPSLYWRLNDPSGTTATDSSGNGRNGTYGTGITLGATGATADGDTAVTLPRTAAGVITSSYNPFGASFTVEGFSARTTITNTQALFGGSGATTCYMETASNGNDVLFDADSTSTVGRVSWTNVFAGAGAYCYWVLTYDSATFAAELFINAVSKGSLATQAVAASPGNFTVGTFAGGNNPFGGQMDEIAVYPTILSSARIAAHYAAATTAGVATAGGLSASTALARASTI